MRYLPLPGRILFALIFIASAPMQFSSATMHYAGAHGVPAPHVLVPIAGILALVGGLMVLVGWQTRIGALLLILFLVPVTLMMHNFWAESDAAARMQQQVNFMKNLSLIGGALLIAYFGAGPLSVDDWLHARAARGERPRAFAPTEAS
jgi:putative oxidoreductase